MSITLQILCAYYSYEIQEELTCVLQLPIIVMIFILEEIWILNEAITKWL